MYTTQLHCQHKTARDERMKFARRTTGRHEYGAPNRGARSTTPMGANAIPDGSGRVREGGGRNPQQIVHWREEDPRERTTSWEVPCEAMSKDLPRMHGDRAAGSNQPAYPSLPQLTCPSGVLLELRQPLDLTGANGWPGRCPLGPQGVV